MTTGVNVKSSSALQARGEERRRRSPMDHFPPPANSNKPLTPFSIEDILSKPAARKNSHLCSSSRSSPAEKVSGSGTTRNGLPAQTSPLCALEELASKTFKGLELSVIQAAEGRDHVTTFGQRQTSKKRRKSRTAFTNHQIYELEKRFLYQKYLSPADRDQIAQQLGLTNAQVITWFQNRRAKLKRDLEEMKADVESLKKMPPQQLEKLVHMDEFPDEGAGSKNDSSDISPKLSPASGLEPFPSSPHSSRDQTTDEFSEDEEIDVDD
ncbi:transcription factor LBX2 [Leucoraja erinacea]|uniref:transcription factor LBX2 n=1 Tax=Leucoraja erinaceus TaxID=7782 RepID=UPI0024569DE7|nr:transcription factor LBX2 [Leucoraja erinacea]